MNKKKQISIIRRKIFGDTTQFHAKSKSREQKGGMATLSLCTNMANMENVGK